MDTIKTFFEELQFGRLEKPVKAHLQNVYAAMGVALLACAVGGYLHLFTNFMIDGFFSLLVSTIVQLGILVALVAMSPTSENRSTRFVLMIVFSMLSGLNMGPILDRAIDVDPSIIATAFLATSLVFICFTLSALLSSDRKWLALGGILFSGLSWLTLMLFLNIFIGSQLIFQIYPYIALVLMCGFVLYDTQLIVEKCRNGDDDYIMHCLMLFLDFIDIFRMLVIILTEKEGRRDKRKRN